MSVATPLDPRAVKAFVNEGKAKYYGVETIFHYTISPQWSAEGNYSYLVVCELNPNRFIRRLPPQQGFLAIRSQLGTADDLFAPTNETVAQIRDRVLPIGATINGVTITDDNSQ